METLSGSGLNSGTHYELSQALSHAFRFGLRYCDFKEIILAGFKASSNPFLILFVSHNGGGASHESL